MINKVKDIICATTFLEKEELDSIGQDDLLTQVGVDSINIVYIIGEIEDEFGFKFPDEELLLDNFDTLNKMMNIVKKYSPQNVN
ncbi:acyl carrier protein [Clostridium sporogenes]|uniref:acyl carrier protein n=1 Tax=Clostridium sporogenes TaxID=1509 RepID=UPI002237BF91|nr:acyl carrier protein [Clostridium sporogenes]MCW6109107.1 acyl carrier protein [Clostridium sporogenes]